MPGLFRHPPQPQQRRPQLPAPPVGIYPPRAISQRAIYTPNVEGNQNVVPAPLPNQRKLYAPTVDVHQTISFSAVISQRALHAPIIANVTLISPSSVPSQRALHAPKVQGAPQFINIGAVISQRAVYTPAITGADQGIHLFIGGIEVTSYFAIIGAGTNAATGEITSQAIGRATFTFDLIDTAQSLVGPSGLFSSVQAMVGLVVKLQELGTTLFAGCLDTIAADREMPFDSNVIITYHCTALDKTSICDHRIVPGTTYTAGTDVIEVILDIAASYLDGEGISTVLLEVGALGSLNADITFNYTTVSNAFNQLATLSGTVWWIDNYQQLHFSPLANLPAAPWAITETAPIRNYQGTAMVTAALSGGASAGGYANKVYAVSNLNVLPGTGTGGSGSSSTQGTTETYTFANGQPGVISEYIGGVLTPVGFSVTLPVQSVVSMTYDGDVQTVVDITQFSGQTSSGPTDYGPWFYSQGSSDFTWTNGPPPNNGTVTIQYVPGNAQGTNQTSVSVGEAISPTAPSGAPLGTCGSGIYEEVVKVTNVSLITDLDAIAEDYLTRNANVPIELVFQTDKPGLLVGQQLSVALPSLGLGTLANPIKLGISYMDGTVDPGGGPLGFGSFFRWQVRAINNYNAQTWVNYFAQIIARTENPAPVLQYETATFVLGQGSSLSSGTSVTNPYIVQRTGLLTEILLAASTPPSGQNLVLTITRNGLTIATVVMPAGTSANQLITVSVPASNDLYLFSKDVLNCNVSYQLGTGTLVSAAGVTLKVVWAM